MSAKLKCQVCQKEFEALRSDTKYCSTCKITEGRKRFQTYEKRHKESCPLCGKEMLRRAKYCRSCNNKLQPWRKVGEENSNWKGGTTKANGYIYIRTKRIEGGVGSAYKAEHHIVWEKENNKVLPKDWVIHHLNGIKDDNKIENLSARPRKEHSPKSIVEPYQQRILKLEEQIKKLLLPVNS